MSAQIPNIEDTRELLKKNQIGIVGVGETEQGKIPGKSSFHFLSEASKLAIEDAGLNKADVDGVITAFSLVEETFMHCTTLPTISELIQNILSQSQLAGQPLCG